METNSRIERFFYAAEELITGKFILAEIKISDLLRSIAASEELTRLFSAATEGYDYAAAKREYLRISGKSNGRPRGEAFLPEDRGEILAFVFCLLAEFDAGKMKFNDFLLCYFYEDGSFTASYERFVNRMIRPFRDIVRNCFPVETQEMRATERQAREENTLERLNECLVLERERIAATELAQEDALAAARILGEAQAALGREDLSAVKALLCGYLYFLQVTNAANEDSDALFVIAGELD